MVGDNNLGASVGHGLPMDVAGDAIAEETDKSLVSRCKAKAQ